MIPDSTLVAAKKRLKDGINSSGISREDIATKLDIASKTLGNMLADGDARFPSPFQLAIICELIEVDMCFIVTGNFFFPPDVRTWVKKMEPNEKRKFSILATEMLRLLAE